VRDTSTTGPQTMNPHFAGAGVGSRLAVGTTVSAGGPSFSRHSVSDAVCSQLSLKS
jgi:hypothetical protein